MLICRLIYWIFNQGSLREHRGQTAEYVIPRGDWFDFISSPHYVAEMVIFFLSWLLLMLAYALLIVKPYELRPLLPFFFTGNIRWSVGCEWRSWLHYMATSHIRGIFYFPQLCRILDSLPLHSFVPPTSHCIKSLFLTVSGR